MAGSVLVFFELVLLPGSIFGTENTCMGSICMLSMCSSMNTISTPRMCCACFSMLLLLCAVYSKQIKLKKTQKSAEKEIDKPNDKANQIK